MSSIVDKIFSSERRLNEIPELAEILSKADYVNTMMQLVKKALQLDHPPLWMILNQICTFLKDDRKINEIIVAECEVGFLGTDDYHSFIFTCSLLVFFEYTRINANGKIAQGVNG